MFGFPGRIAQLWSDCVGFKRPSVRDLFLELVIG